MLAVKQDHPLAATMRRCGRCGCRLSRYNSEQHCARCHRVINTREPEWPHVPAHVWHRPEVQQSLLSRDFGRLCQLIRQLCRLRQEDLAAVTGLSQAYLSMLESGSRRLTHIDKIIRMLEGLQAPRELLGPMLLGQGPSGHHSLSSIPSELRPIGGDSSAPPARDGAARSDSASTAILRAVQ